MIIVPCFHSAYLLRSSDGESGLSRFFDTTVDDLKKGWVLTTRRPSFDEEMLFERDAAGRQVAVFPTADEAINFLLNARKAAQQAQERNLRWLFTADIETHGENPLNSKVMCVGLAFFPVIEGRLGRPRVMVIPFVNQDLSRYWSWLDEVRVVGLLREILGDESIPKNFQNGAFDTNVLGAAGCIVRGWGPLGGDTMTASHITDSELPHGLGYLGTRYLECEWWKDDSKSTDDATGVSDAAFRTYCGKDAHRTLLLSPILEGQVRELGLWDLYLEELELSQIMARASARGLAVDEERRAILSKELHQKRDAALVALRNVAGSNHFDPAKPKHLSYLLFKHLRFQVVKETPTGRPSTDKEALVLLGLAAETDHQKAALNALVNFRSASKKLSNWVDGLPILSDGRIHPTWKLLTTTGRMSSSPNVQVWDKSIKRLFRAAPPGRPANDPEAEKWRFTEIDLSQAELRAIGYDANDKELLRMYAEGINVHTANVGFFFHLKCPPEHAKDSNAATEAYLREAVPRLLGKNYDEFPTAPPKKWEGIRRQAKVGEFGCLAASTPIPIFVDEDSTFSTSVPISKVQAGEWTWVWDGQKSVRSQILRVWPTGRRYCVSVRLWRENTFESKITLTGDHLVMLASGSWREARDLEKGTRLKGLNEIFTVIEVGPVSEHEVWDLNVFHPANNFSIEDGPVVANSNYGGTADTLYGKMRSERDENGKLLFPDITMAEVETVLLTKQKVRPDIPRWWEETKIKTQKRGYTECPISGRRRFFRAGFKANDILGTPIQTMVASWMNRSLLRIQRLFDKETGGACHVVQQVHDSLIVECPEPYAQRAGEIMVAAVGEKFSLPGFENCATLPTDGFKIGRHLKD